MFLFRFPPTRMAAARTVALYSWVDPTKWTMHESTTAAGLAVAAAQGRNASTVRSYLNRLDLSTPSTHYGCFWCWSAPPQPPPPPPPPVLAPNRMKRTTVKFTVITDPSTKVTVNSAASQIQAAVNDKLQFEIKGIIRSFNALFPVAVVADFVAVRQPGRFVRNEDEDEE